MDLVSIGEVVRRYGITHRSVRYYEQRNLLSSTRVSGDRYFEPQQIRRLEKILKGKRLGFTLTEIAGFIGAPMKQEDERGFPALDKVVAQRQLQYLQKRRDEIDQAIAELQASIADASLKTRRTSRQSRG